MLIDVLAQTAPAPAASEHSWITGLLAGGGSSAIMGFIIWRIFMHMLPEFLQTLEKQRDAHEKQLEVLRGQEDQSRALERQEQARTRAEFLATLDRIHQNLREDLERERTERKTSAEKIVAALNEQTHILTQLAGNHVSKEGS